MTENIAKFLDLPVDERVAISEVWTRDGLQGWPDLIATQDKIAVVSEMIDAGVRDFDLTSFVSPKVTPQFGDATNVLEGLHPRRDEAEFRVLVVNARSFQRIAEHPVAAEVIDVTGFPISADEAHNLANLGKTHAEHKENMAVMIDAAADGGFTPLMCVATAYGSPLGGPVPTDQVLDLARWGYDRGVRKLMFGDTTGMADPLQAYTLFSTAIRAFPGAQLYAHFHDTRSSGIANTIAAIAAGVRVVDTCLGGAGGEPPTVLQNHVGESGNVCTEDLVAVLDRMGVRLDLDVPAVLEAGRHVERIVGRPLRSQVLRAGLAVAAA